MSGQLLHNLLLFGRILRGLGLEVNPGRMVDVVQALEHVQLGQRSDFYHALRSLLAQRREHLPLFDQAFELFWVKPAEGALLDMGALLRPRRTKPVFVPAPAAAPEPESGADEAPPDPQAPPVVEVTQTFSTHELLRRKDFGDLSGEELEAIKRLMRALVWRMGQRRTRRRQPGGSAYYDLRRTLRTSLRHGGEVLRWAQRQPKYKPRPVVVIADISGSMERYTRLLLHFIYSLAEGLAQPVYSFVFSTRLTNITRQLRGREVDRALDEVGRSVPDWSGGTRIGEAVQTFNFEWGRRVLRRGAVVLFISDGWDRGDATLLKTEMARLQRNCHRLVWLNPLLGSPEYEPLTRGMLAALPHIDNFLPVHNLASLEQLAAQLEHLDGARPARRQPALQPAL